MTNPHQRVQLADLEGSGFELTEPFENLKGRAQSECPLSAHSQLLQRHLP